MSELDEYRSKLTAAIGRTLEAEDEWLSYEFGTYERRAALRRLESADRSEDEARDNLRLYLQCPTEGHGPVIFDKDPNAEYWSCVCPDCQGCQDEEGYGMPEVGRGATQQEAFDDLHERLGTNES